jgi:hypothetical protein
MNTESPPSVSLAATSPLIALPHSQLSPVLWLLSVCRHFVCLLGLLLVFTEVRCAMHVEGGKRKPKWTPTSHLHSSTDPWIIPDTLTLWSMRTVRREVRKNNRRVSKKWKWREKTETFYLQREITSVRLKVPRICPIVLMIRIVYAWRLYNDKKWLETRTLDYW